MLTILGVVLFFIGELIFDKYGSDEITNWLIFYYSTHYFSIVLICLEQSVMNNIKWIRWLFVLFAIIAGFFTIVDLMLINVPIDIYRAGIENRIVSNISLFIITFVTGLISYTLWHKYLGASLARLQHRL